MQDQKHVSIDGYTHISVSVEKTIQKMRDIRSGKIKPLMTSLKKEQDKIGGYYPSDQIVLAGRTGTGKTSKLLQDMQDFCNWDLNPHYKDNLVILYDSWEMPDWRNILRFVSRRGEIPVKQLLDYKKELEEEKFERLQAIAREFKDMPVYINQYSSNVNEWFESKKQAYGKLIYDNPNVQIVNIGDHTRLVTAENEKSEEALITRLMKAGMVLKNTYGMINYWLSQMNRAIETAVSRDKVGSRLPISSDIFGSDAVFQCADIVMALHRPGMYQLEEFEGFPTGYLKDDPDSTDDLLMEAILKQRDGWTGAISLRHNFAINKVEDYNFQPTMFNQ